jgi:putative Mg2+ transporter-C (MgtC) family protein
MAYALRLGAALVAGAILGIDREIKKKPAGLRTHALVSVGAALVVLVTAGASGGNADAVSRSIQGVITGIGFLGAGVVMKHEAEHRVEGLTTAASIWVAAALGMACGAGLAELALVALAAIVVILVGGERVERWMQRRGLGNEDRHPPP